VVDFCIFLLFVATAFILQFDIISGFILDNISPNKILLLLILGIIGLLVFYFIWRWSKWLFVEKIKSKLNGLIEGLTSIFKMKTKWYYLAHSLFIWLCYLTMFYVCIFTIEETATISFEVVIMGFIFGSLAVGFTNGGIGAFPISIASVLLLYGISKDAGTALGWIIWTSQTVFTIVLGLLSYLFLSINNKN
jgi:hypothetical protein